MYHVIGEWKIKENRKGKNGSREDFIFFAVASLKSLLSPLLYNPRPGRESRVTASASSSSSSSSSQLNLETYTSHFHLNLSLWMNFLSVFSSSSSTGLLDNLSLTRTFLDFFWLLLLASRFRLRLYLGNTVYFLLFFVRRYFFMCRLLSGEVLLLV